MYGERGVKVFIREYGKPSIDDALYFTGTRRADFRNVKPASPWRCVALTRREKSSRMWVAR